MPPFPGPPQGSTQSPAKTAPKNSSPSPLTSRLSPEIIDRYVKRRQQTAHCTHQPLNALHTPFMPLHTLFQLRQPPRLSNPHQLIHLVPQDTQVCQDLSFKLGHLFFPS